MVDYVKLTFAEFGVLFSYPAERIEVDYIHASFLCSDIKALTKSLPVPARQ
jgi:hypothetical protein